MKKLLLTFVCMLTLFSAIAGTQEFGSGTTIPGLATASSGASNDAVKWTSEALGVELSIVQCYKSSNYLMAVKSKAAITFTVSKAIQKITITTPAGGSLAANGALALYTGDAADYDCYNICKDNSTTYEFVPSVKTAGTTYVLKNIKNPENTSKDGNVQIASMTIVYEGETEEKPVEPTTVEVANIAALLSANADLASGATSTDTYRLTNPVTAIYRNGNNLYVKDNTGYMLVYGSLGKTYDNGDIIPAGIEGQLKNYYGLYQFNPNKATFGDATAGEEVKPISTTVDDAAADGQNSYIELKGVTIEGMAETGNFTITDPKTSETITGRNNFKIAASNGTNMTLRGFVAVYNGAYQIYPTEVLNGEGQAAAVAPTFNPAAGEVIAGTKVNIYTNTPDAAIYYTTDGTEPTTASTLFTQAIEINADMTIKAIAVKEGMVNSSVTTAVYTVKVVDENIATFNFAAPQTLTPAYPATIDDESLTKDGDSKSATVTGKYFTVGNVAVSNTKGSSTDAKIYYQSSGKIQLRVYNGGSTTIQSTDPDNNIVKIVFTYNNGKDSYSKVTAPTEGTWSASEGTWTGDAQSVTFNYSGTQQINQIEVVCANGITEGSEITGPEEPKAVEVASIAEWLTANADIASGKKSEKSYKFTCPLTVARKLDNNLYVTDGTDWMLIFSYNLPTYNNGDVIPAGVEGVFSNYSGLPELEPVVETLAEATPGTAIEPTVTTLATFSELGKNAYIKLNNVSITDVNNRNFNVTDGTNTVAGYNSFKIEGLENVANVDIIAFIGYRNGNYQLSIVEFADASGVDAVIGDNNAPVEYYNLQGLRVMNPAMGGMYIKRQGNTVSKVIVR